MLVLQPFIQNQTFTLPSHSVMKKKTSQTSINHIQSITYPFSLKFSQKLSKHSSLILTNNKFITGPKLTFKGSGKKEEKGRLRETHLLLLQWVPFMFKILIGMEPSLWSEQFEGTSYFGERNWSRHVRYWVWGWRGWSWVWVSCTWGKFERYNVRNEEHEVVHDSKVWCPRCAV